MEDSRAIFLLLFPMIGELDRAPVGDVTILPFSKYSIEHSRSTEQANMAAV